MAIIDTLLSTPVDVNKLQAENAPRVRLLDGAFANLMAYAKKHWNYAASGKTGGQNLLDGTANTAPCGGIATALKLVYIDGLGIPKEEIEYIRVTGYLWTGPTYLCFDPKVKGNLRNLKDRNYANGCIFNEHYYLKAGGRFYDPCLSTAYNVKDQSILEKFSGSKTAMIGDGPNQSKLMLTNNMQTGVLYLPKEQVPGFQGAWVKFPATQQNVKEAMGKKFFNNEFARQNGNSTFAKLVKQLR